jgi:hypothetical protein
VDAAALAAVLRNPSATGVLDVSAIAVADAHGVTPLVYAALRDSGLLARQPEDLRRALARAAKEAALLEDVRRCDASRVLDALAAERIAAVVFKGGALAYTHYPEPWMRPHVDVDFWVHERDADRAGAVLERLDYMRTARPTGQHVTHQSTYVATIGGVQTAYDVHSRFADPEAFAGVLTFDEALASSVPLQALGAHARALGPMHALAISCVHRVAHHHDDDHLLRVVDVDRLARRLSSDEWRCFAEFAAARGIRAVCRRGLELAVTRLATPVPDEVTAALSESSGQEPTAVFIGGARKVDILRSDLRSLHWRARLRLLREHLFPPAAYMLAVNPSAARGVLPFLYIRRIMRGAIAWFRPLE